ncbi:MAG: hypothetical protein IK093_12725 [Ruminiclostridium sp.]|nr:hypothetical protein [Ruminiclostridium sp.]
MNETASKLLRLLGIVIVSAVIGIFLGHLVSNYEVRYMLSRKYIGEYNGIEIYQTGDVNEENLALHKAMLEYAPDVLTECCDRLYFVGSDLELPAQEAIGIGQALGLTQNRTIYISTEGYSPYVVFHELFHAYDNAHDEISSNDLTFISAFNENRGVIPVFAAHASAYSSEFFAQSGAMYLLLPNELEVEAPETFSFFHDKLQIPGLELKS